MSEHYSLAYTNSIEDAVIGMHKRGEEGPAQLRGHIVNQHYNPQVLAWFGVARFDIDLAQRMNIPLDWVVKKGIERLELGWKDPEGFLTREPNPGYARVYGRLGLPWGEDWCKLMVVKNLIYIDQSGMGRVDWARVSGAVPAYRSVTLDIRRDSSDPFLKDPLYPYSKPTYPIILYADSTMDGYNKVNGDKIFNNLSNKVDFKSLRSGLENKYQNSQLG